MLLVSVERDGLSAVNSYVVESVDRIVASPSAAHNEYPRGSKFFFFLILKHLRSLLFHFASSQSFLDNTLHIYRHLY
jgi:hypothetical protein